MTLFTKTALATGVIVLAVASGLGVKNVVQADERGFNGIEKRVKYAHAGGGHGFHGRRHYGGRHGRRGKRMRRVRNMMELYDANDDQKLTTEEVRAGRQAQLDQFDRNNDGGIDLQEFAPLWAEIRKQRIIRRFQRLDRNADGKVTSDEFVKPAVRMVERFDRNGDGALSREDRRRGFGRGSRGSGEGRGFWRRMQDGGDPGNAPEQNESGQQQ